MPNLKEKIQNAKESVNDSISGIANAGTKAGNTHTLNKMLSNSTLPTNVNNPFGSFIKKGRFNILPGDVAFEFNTYKNWAPFSILMEPFNFIEDKSEYNGGTYIDEKGRLVNEPITDINAKNMGIIGRKSLFNPTTAVNETNEARVSANAPLLDERELNIRRFEENDCSIRELIKATQSGRLGVATYSYADFMYCKYLGKCSNEYLITLRRFPYPPGDHINTINPETEKDTQKHVNDIGRMVTWMGTPGNEMSNILKYSVKIPYKKFDAKIDTINEDQTVNGESILGNIMNLGHQRNRQLIESGMSGGPQLKMLQQGLSMLPGGKKFGDFLGDPPYSAATWRTNYDENKSYGPLDVITQTYQRQGANDGGLEFNHEIQLRFDYELRAYDGINGRSAMLDLIGNILATCYTTGRFWGGAQQFLGASQSNQYANLPIFMNNFALGNSQTGAGKQTPGDFAQYSRNVASSLGMIFGINNTAEQEERLNAETKTYSAKRTKSQTKNASVVEQAKSLFSDVGSLIKNAGSALGSLLYGGLINKLGRPQVLAVNSLLTDAPTGLWHLTIGNPKAPIMSMGNMIIDNCEIEHKGPLGIDGFPTGITVTVKLIHGKPRENTSIERMYLQGDYRIYSPMGDRLLKMYWGAPSLASIAANQEYEKEIKAGKFSREDWERSKYYVGDFAQNVSSPDTANKTEIGNLKRYFGTVAGLGEKDGVAYLTSIGKEALYGSTPDSSAKENDGKHEGLEKQRNDLKIQAEKEKEVSTKEKDMATARKDMDKYNSEITSLYAEGKYNNWHFDMSVGENIVNINATAGRNEDKSFDTTRDGWLDEATSWVLKGDGNNDYKEAVIKELKKLDSLTTKRNAARNKLNALSKS